MKKLLSLFLAVVMIFSCTTLAVNALHIETVTEKVYEDNLLDTVTQTTYKDITYADIPGLNSFEGEDFIEVITRVTSNSTTYVETNELKDTIGRPVKDEDGKVITKNYNVTDTKTKQFELLGIPVNFIYNNDGPLFWGNLTAHPGIEAEIDITKSDITLLFGNVNMYLLKVMKSLYSDFRFYTDANAVKCINFIGNLFYPNFTEISKGSRIFVDKEYIYNKNGVNYADEDIFFERVAELSGLVDLIQVNWVEYGDARANFKPLLLLLGVTEETLLPSEYYRGDRIATEILRCAFTKIMGEGPVAYFVRILESLTKAYHLYYYNAIKLLFTQKAHYYEESDLKTLSGLLNLIVNNNDKDINKFQFAPLPEKRLAITNDMSEFYLILLMYMNLNANYRNNRSVIENFKQDIRNSSVISGKVKTDEDGNAIPSDKSRIISIIDGVTGDSLEKVFYDETLTNLMVENITGKPDEYLGNIGEAIARMVKKIADWFQMWIDIFTGKLEFGAGAFD